MKKVAPPPGVSGKTTTTEWAAPFWVTFCTFLGSALALPFAFGSCCWLTFVGRPATPTALWLCHALQFALLLSVLSNTVQYFVFLGRSRPGSLAEGVVGPALCGSVAAVLLMVDPAFYLFEDLRIITPRRPGMRGIFALHGCARLGLVLLLCSAAWMVRRLRESASRSTLC